MKTSGKFNQVNQVFFLIFSHFVMFLLWISTSFSGFARVFEPEEPKACASPCYRIPISKNARFMCVLAESLQFCRFWRKSSFHFFANLFLVLIWVQIPEPNILHALLELFTNSATLFYEPSALIVLPCILDIKEAV